MRFSDRHEAGIRLAEKLADYADAPDTLVLALPRGGVPVGYEVASRLHLPFDILLVRKLGLPGHEELAVGAIAADGIRVVNEALMKQLNLDTRMIDKIAEEEQRELDRRYRVYRDDRPFPAIEGKDIILVDDGVATGATMRAGIAALRQKLPHRVIVAIPAAPDTVHDDLPEADEIVCLHTSGSFYGVGQWYENFSQLNDSDVQALLRRADMQHKAGAA